MNLLPSYRGIRSGIRERGGIKVTSVLMSNIYTLFTFPDDTSGGYRVTIHKTSITKTKLNATLRGRHRCYFRNAPD